MGDWDCTVLPIVWSKKYYIWYTHTCVCLYKIGRSCCFGATRNDTALDTKLKTEQK